MNSKNQKIKKTKNNKEILEKEGNKILNNKRKRTKNPNKNKTSKTKTKHKKEQENFSNNIDIKDNEKEKELLKLKNIHFSKCIVKDAQDKAISSSLEINLFETFKSIDNNISYLVYVDKFNNIVFYDLNDNKTTCKIKNSHNENIFYIRYYLDKINKRDLLLTISHENNIKVWNINSLQCIFDIDEDNKNVNSANFLFTENQLHIIAVCEENRPYIELNIYDLNGEKEEEIKYFHGAIYFLKTFYNKKNEHSYIITGHYNYIISYDYSKGKQYRQYKDGKNVHPCAVISEKDEEIRLIESCWDGNVRIWNFDSGKLMKKINLNPGTISEKRLNGICLWGIDYIFAGYNEGYIILIDIKNGIEIKKIKDNDNAPILSIEKISIHLGEFLITQEYNRNEIKLWVIN